MKGSKVFVCTLVVGRVGRVREETMRSVTGLENLLIGTLCKYVGLCIIN